MPTVSLTTIHIPYIELAISNPRVRTVRDLTRSGTLTMRHARTMGGHEELQDIHGGASRGLPKGSGSGFTGLLLWKLFYVTILGKPC